MLKLILAASFALAAQDAPKAAPPKPPPPRREQLSEVEKLALENIQLRFQVEVAKICGRVKIDPTACVVDPASGFAYERPTPTPPETVTAKPEAKK